MQTNKADIPTAMKVLRAAAEQLPRKIVQVDGDVRRLEDGRKLFSINEVDGQGSVVDPGILHIVVSKTHMHSVTCDKELKSLLQQ